MTILSICSLLLCFVTFYFRILNADQNRSFSVKNFSNDSNFDTELALYGDAKVISNGTSIRISGSMVSSAGRVMYKKPFKLFEGKPRKMVSFSVSFVFSLTRENGNGLAFEMVPVGFPLDIFDGDLFGLLGEGKYSLLGVEFGNHVGIDIGSFVSAKSRKFSSAKNLALKSGAKLQVWIDYEASSRRLEVRLSKQSKNKPIDPLLSSPIDFSQIWKRDEEVVVGLSASSGNSTQKCNVYSWNFRLRTMPIGMHSEPLNPNKKEELLNDQKRSDCALRVVGALILGAACGGLGTLFVLFLWTIFGNRRPVVPEDYALPPAKEVDYKLTS